MKANPGGQIATAAAIGRDSLISQLWETLEQQSVVMTAERRIGKTTVMQKMKDEARNGWQPVYQDLESCHSAREFAMAVYKEVHEFLSTQQKVARRAGEWLQKLGGVEVGGIFKLPEKSEADWKDILIRTIEDLIHENEGSGSRLLFLWDEVPFMLANIRDREGEHTAMEVLDVLRHLRQTHGSSGLRMIITGSIGLHHVLTTLKDKNYGNSPVNDMLTIEVHPLTEDHAQDLARQLLQGEKLVSPNEKETAQAIAIEADHFPFYIHHIVKALKMQSVAATPEGVAQIVARQLVDPNDPWELLHYRERIPRHYGPDENTAFIILDELASKKGAASVKHLFKIISAASAFDDRERLLRLLTLLERDHYLQRDTAGSYAFRFPLIRRWWKINRGL